MAPTSRKGPRLMPLGTDVIIERRETVAVLTYSDDPEATPMPIAALAEVADYLAAHDGEALVLEWVVGGLHYTVSVVDRSRMDGDGEAS